MPVDIDRIALQIGERVRDEATEDGVIPFITGDLRKSVQVSIGGKGRAIVGSNLNYARAVHDGRPAITIGPKNKKVLRFTIGEKVVFARKVNQPARKGKPFLVQGAKAVEAAGFDFLLPDVVGELSDDMRKDFEAKIVIRL